MRHRLVLLPVLLATLVCAPPALAWTWPQDGPVLQPFVLGGDPYAAGQHRGIDVAGPAGASVRAPTAGTVSFAGFVPSGGRTVTIQTADGLAVTLLHLGSLGVSHGATLAEGATVGTLALGGDADHPVPYVQMGVRIAADPQGYLDPLLFLPARVPAEAPGAPADEPALDPVEAPLADPQVSMPEAGAAPPALPPGPGDPVAPAATGGVAIPAEAGESATVEAPARVVEPVVTPDPNGSVSAPASAPTAAASEGEPEDLAESAAGVEDAPSGGRAPAEPGAAPAHTATVAARAALREPRGFPAWIAAVIAALALITPAPIFGWRRWRSAPAPAQNSAAAPAPAHGRGHDARAARGAEAHPRRARRPRPPAHTIRPARGLPGRRTLAPRPPRTTGGAPCCVTRCSAPRN